MKIVSMKGLLGLVAVGGAVAYVRKHGGLRPALDHLIAKKNELLAKADEVLIKKTEPMVDLDEPVTVQDEPLISEADIVPPEGYGKRNL